MAFTLGEIEQGHYTNISLDETKNRVEEVYNSSTPNSRDRARCAFLLGAYFEMRNYELAREYYIEAHTIAVALNDRRLLSDTLHTEAIHKFKQGDLAAVQKLEEQALQIGLEEHHPFRVGFCYYVLGIVALLYGANEDGVDYLNRSIRIAREHGYLKLLLRLYSKLSELYLISKDLSKAREFATALAGLAQDLSIQEESREAHIRLATIELEREDYQQVAHLIDLVQSNLAAEDQSHRCITHTLFGKIRAAERKWEDARVELEKALDLASYPNAERVRSNIHIHLSQLYLDTEEPQHALEQSLDALADANAARDVYSQKEALRLVQQCYKALGNFEQAFKHLEKYNSLVVESDTASLRNRLEYHEMKNELEVERANSETSRQQSELKQIEHEHKEKKLLEQIRHLLAQAAQLDKFRDELKSLIKNAPIGDPVARELRFKLNSLPTTVMNFDEFSTTFDTVHPGFTKTLFRDHPALTPTEVKLCTVLRLNLKSEDIARLFCLSERTVETHRLNIRRKLGLPRETSLSNFLNSL